MLKKLFLSLAFFTIALFLIYSVSFAKNNSTVLTIIGDVGAPTKQVRFYCQYDNKYTKSYCDITSHGCTPTSMAMILATFGDTKWNPLNTALSQKTRRNGCFKGGTNESTLLNNFRPWFKSMGYKWPMVNLASGRNFNVKQAKKYLDNGYLLLAGANMTYNRSRSGSGGHAVVIAGLNTQTRIAKVYDPTFCTSDKDYSIRNMDIDKEVVFNSVGSGWYWVYPIKK